MEQYSVELCVVILSASISSTSFWKKKAEAFDFFSKHIKHSPLPTVFLTLMFFFFDRISRIRFLIAYLHWQGSEWPVPKFLDAAKFPWRFFGEHKGKPKFFRKQVLLCCTSLAQNLKFDIPILVTGKKERVSWIQFDAKFADVCARFLG